MRTSDDVEWRGDDEGGVEARAGAPGGQVVAQDEAPKRDPHGQQGAPRARLYGRHHLRQVVVRHSAVEPRRLHPQTHYALYSLKAVIDRRTLPRFCWFASKIRR